jgi:hypothetical protein
MAIDHGGADHAFTILFAAGAGLLLLFGWLHFGWLHLHGLGLHRLCPFR